MNKHQLKPFVPHANGPELPTLNTRLTSKMGLNMRWAYLRALALALVRDFDISGLKCQEGTIFKKFQMDPQRKGSYLLLEIFCVAVSFLCLFYISRTQT